MYNTRCKYVINHSRLPIDVKLSIDRWCPGRPLTSEAARCTRDYITIYDGKNEIDPKIGTFCGFGR